MQQLRRCSLPQVTPSGGTELGFEPNFLPQRTDFFYKQQDGKSLRQPLPLWSDKHWYPGFIPEIQLDRVREGFDRVHSGPRRASQVVLVVKNPPANARDVRDAGSIPGWGRSPRGGNANPLQYSCLENPMDSGAWRATVHGVARSRTRLSGGARHTSSLYNVRLVSAV